MDGRADFEINRRWAELRLANYRRNLTRCSDADRRGFEALVWQAEREIAGMTAAGMDVPAADGRWGQAGR
ncbi:MAG TPA: hypothetical protein VF796_12025 [Humisphaera sp.]